MSLWVQPRNEDTVKTMEIQNPRKKKKKTWRVCNNIKVVVIIFFDYLKILCHLSDAMWCKRLDLWVVESWQLHHSNASAHPLHMIQTFLAKHNNTPMVLPGSLLSWHDCDFGVLSKLTMTLKGIQFQSWDDTVWKHDCPAVPHSRKCIPKMLLIMELLGEVCPV